MSSVMKPPSASSFRMSENLPFLPSPARTESSAPDFGPFESNSSICRLSGTEASSSGSKIASKSYTAHRSQETQSPYVFVSAQPGINLFQITWNSACDGKYVKNLAIIDSSALAVPELRTFAQRQFRENIIAGKASREACVVEDVLLNPGRNRSADHQNQAVMAMEKDSPRPNEAPRERIVILSHP